MSPTMKTSDLFGRDPAGYARFRPRYPAALFEYLGGLTPSRRRAWDCATGNGQAAVGLADHFDEVIATDVSAEQLAHAERRANIRYFQAPADTVEVEGSSVDLVTVAQALHWLDLPTFYDEVRRVARPGGVLAAWCYHHITIGDAVDPVLRRLMLETVAPYWPPGRRFVEERYQTIAFPFDEIRAPELTMRAEWSLDELVGYVSTWSAVQRYREATQVDPVAAVRPALAEAWGSPEEKLEVRWPLHFRLGLVAEGVA
jgi:SAM-dependent methyltransferase